MDKFSKRILVWLLGGCLFGVAPWIFEFWRWFYRSYDYICLGAEG